MLRYSIVPTARRSLLVLFLVVSGLAAIGQNAFASGSAESLAHMRTISVSASGVASGPPDMAIVRLGVETRNENVKRAINDAADRTKRIVASLESNGVASSDIQTVDYNLGFVQAQRSNNSASTGSTSTTGRPTGYYRVSDVAKVTVRALDTLGPILDGALGAGANSVQGISFELSDSTSLEQKARAAAFDAARAKAEQLAKLAGVKLGPVLTVSAAGGSPVHALTYRMQTTAAPAVNPGNLQVSTTLQVVYQIAR